MATVRELLAIYGSPLYLYETQQIRHALADLRTALPGEAEILYSLKANPHPDVVRTLRSAGCGAEISSTGELRAALQAGFQSGRCLYTGPAKTLAEIGEAIAAGVRRFSVESLDDLRRVGHVAAAREVLTDCLIRVTGAAEGAASIRMSGPGTQFGVPAEALFADLSAYLSVPGTRICGAHFFPVSNARDEASLTEEFLSSIATAARLRAAGLPLDLLDLGGGFSAPFAIRRERDRYRGLRLRLEEALDAHLDGWRDGRPGIAFESGRYLVAESGCLASTVVEVKRTEGRIHVLIDSGINHLGGMSASGRLMKPAVAPFLDRGTPAPDEASTDEVLTNDEQVTVAGPLCTPADVLGHHVQLGPAKAGDVVIVPNVGAYGATAGLLAFLSRLPPAEVVLHGGEVISASRIELRRSPLRCEAAANRTSCEKEQSQ